MAEMFKEGVKTPLGNLRTHSGTLAFTDGIHTAALQGFQGVPIINIDLEREDVDIPIYGLIADGKRYILLAVDEAKPLQISNEPVDIDTDETIETDEVLDADDD